jgi:hypothetical protein
MKYSSLHPLLQLALAPLLGLAFVVFLPCVGFLLFGRVLLELAVPPLFRAGPKKA